MAKLEADCLKAGRAPWPGRCHRAKFTGGGIDAMQAKRKKTGQGVSMKRLKGAHFEVASRKIATFRKDFGEGDLENLEIVLLFVMIKKVWAHYLTTQLVCLLYTSPSPRDRQKSRMPSSA